MKPGRNDPCPCGSGKKYKKCCGIHPEGRPVPQAVAEKTPDTQSLNALLALFSQQRYAEAAQWAQSLIARFPSSGVCWKVLGMSLNQMGQHGNALTAMQNAVALLPDDAEAHYNLGLVFHISGRLNEAEACYRRTLKIRPDFVDALNNLAMLFHAQDNLVMALNVSIHSLRASVTTEAKSIFFDCVKRLRCTQGSNELRNMLIVALSAPWGRPSELMLFSTDLVRLDHDIGGCVTRAVEAWPVLLSAEELFGEKGLAALNTDKLLSTLLNSAPICDVDLEHFLTMARHALLECIENGRLLSKSTAFYSALVQQCFINEYVFSATDDELGRAAELRDSLLAALNSNKPVPAHWILAVASYFPLYAFTGAYKLLEMSWPENVAAVLVQQLQEPAEEQQLRAGIPRLTDVEDDVSLRVQNQYEQNPYPRWVKAAPAGVSESIVDYLVRKFPMSVDASEHHGNRVLIAGCGTGQQSIRAAQQFQDAELLAIDLSLTSLGYAKRKTQELGITSIVYAQADLLKLGTLDQRFDMIDSSGVLHHLADPWAGWRVRLSLLRPKGYMKLGFYSELARNHIVAARAYIAEQGYGDSASEIRRCRKELIGLGNNVDFSEAFITRDFFSISTCRDMLFHVQEHRMTLTGIAAFLHENNLQFLGFEIGEDVLLAYKQRFPNDPAAVNLSQWHVFETEHPATFYGMYQFWVQQKES